MLELPIEFQLSAWMEGQYGLKAAFILLRVASPRIFALTADVVTHSFPVYLDINAAVLTRSTLLPDPCH